ncbi:MAG: ribonuclease HII [Acidimicrobiia bacterium]|nr:ribonuclease HII [Acidimicrobiia bacterium]
MTTTVPRLRPSLRTKAPGVAAERTLWDAGLQAVVGVDEVGRGSWAGPLTVGAAVIPRDSRIYKVRDSKQLTEGEREAMFDRIAGWVERWAVGHATAHECDALGMSEAQRLATDRALDGLGVEVEHVLVDGKWDFVGRGNTTTLVRGDATSLSIAAASILAKVTRDRIMRGHADAYPWYSFESNKGYPCPRHRAALQAIGPSTLHRKTWAFMPALVWTGVPECRPAPETLALF